MKSARVIGAGLSGLSAAWCLADAGWQVELIEAANEPGGLIHTHHTPEGLVETAANAFVSTDTTARWFERLGIPPVSPKPESKKRYIFRDGRARRWPLTVFETTSMAAHGGLAMLSRSTKARPGETIETWGHRVVGKGATRWLIGAALQGIYATPPNRLSAEAIFSGRRKGKTRLATPAGGMGEFIARLHDGLVARGVHCTFSQRVMTLDANTPTIIATNAAAAAALIAPHAPALAQAVAGVEMRSISSVTAFFVKSSSDLHGFGVLFPRGCGVSALGVLFNDDTFPDRSTLRWERWIYDLPIDDEPAAGQLVAADRAVLTSRADKAIALHLTSWPNALPVYDHAILDVKAKLADRPPWLALAGNYLGRLGVAALLEQAEEAASALKEPRG